MNCANGRSSTTDFVLYVLQETEFFRDNLGHLQRRYQKCDNVILTCSLRICKQLMRVRDIDFMSSFDMLALWCNLQKSALVKPPDRWKRNIQIKAKKKKKEKERRFCIFLRLIDNYFELFAGESIDVRRIANLNFRAKRG